MENSLDKKTNKMQALLKLEIAKNNLIGISHHVQAQDWPKVDKALAMIDEVLDELKIEIKYRGRDAKFKQ